MTGAVTWARVSYRQQRWELIFVAVAMLAGATAMIWFAGVLDTMRSAEAECLSGLRAQFESASGPPLACQSAIDEWYDAQAPASMLRTFALTAPLGIGVILGTPVVAREFDGGTAQLAWSLSASRIGWLVRRISFVAAFGLILLGVVAIASEALAAAVEPDRNMAADFTFFGQRGLPLVARGAGALMISVLVGVIIGRVLPALLVSVAVVTLAFAVLSYGQQAWNRGDASVQQLYDQTGEPVPFDYSALAIGSGVLRPDGTFLTYDEAFERGLPVEFLQGREGRLYASAADLDADRPFGYEAQLVIPGSRYRDLVLRDVAVWLTAGLAALGAAAVAVNHRRPT